MDLSLDELIAKRTKHSAGCSAGGHNKGVSALLDLRTNRTNGNGGPIRHSGRTTASSSSDSNGRYVNTPSTSRYRERANGEYSNDGVYRIVLSNLDFGVTSEDLRLLLGEFGSVKCAEVRHNEYGKSLGKADVIFTNKNSALMAIRRYHNTCLDGRYIKFKLISKLSTSNWQSISNGVRPSRWIFARPITLDVRPLEIWKFGRDCYTRGFTTNFPPLLPTGASHDGNLDGFRGGNNVVYNSIIRPASPHVPIKRVTTGRRHFCFALARASKDYETVSFIDIALRFRNVTRNLERKKFHTSSGHVSFTQ